MTREDAKKAAEVMLAYADGEQVEIRLSDNAWRVVNNPTFNWEYNNYRVKSEPTYRPFKDAEECWNEMQKHQPFGWVKDKEDGRYVLITSVEEEEDDGIAFGVAKNWAMDKVPEFYTFADGSVFGIKEE